MHTIPQGSFSGERKTPWQRGTGVESVLEQWRGDRQVSPNLVLD